ncbi:hypothetical protein PVAND_007177 [Polypedilum vanderplanki]|uniref:Uncharacterized protein n=1 Tax=Polypedilum vanderplanki TaxID=319348 RepID=A0A9J6C6G5_POLVA|nr:hypothetical protein PVAND_007177 [Polypedilum vanderplanki]
MARASGIIKLKFPCMHTNTHKSAVRKHRSPQVMSHRQLFNVHMHFTSDAWIKILPFQFSILLLLATTATLATAQQQAAKQPQFQIRVEAKKTEQDQELSPATLQQIRARQLAQQQHQQQQSAEFYSEEEEMKKIFQLWICPEGATFHQVHLICMPPSDENICQQSSKYHFVNDYLYKPINMEEFQSKPNVSLRYHERYYPENIYSDDRQEYDDEHERAPTQQHQNAYRQQQQQQQQNAYRSPDEINISLQQRRPYFAQTTSRYEDEEQYNYEK